jgi:hypothetical protein
VDEKPFLPELIAGHQWYLFVDPAIDAAQLQFVAQALQDEYDFLNALLSEEPQPKQTQKQQEQVSGAQVSGAQAKDTQERDFQKDQSYSAAP